MSRSKSKSNTDSVFLLLMRRGHERTWQWGIVLFLFVFFVLGRAYQVSDSLFTVLTAHALIHEQSINLKPYLNEPRILKEALPVVDNVQLGRQNMGTPHERWVMLYPQTIAYLSIPLVLITDLIYPVVPSPPSGGAGFFNLDNEIRQQWLIAGAVCALYGLIMYRLAKLWFPSANERPWALLLLLATVIGSSVTSILSRAVWSDTWACLLSMMAILHLACAQKNRQAYRPLYLGVVLTLMFYCKPIYALPILALTLWAWWIDRAKTLWLIGLGIIGAGFYAWWSQSIFGTLVQKYSSFEGFQLFTAEAFWGVLISPSRGLIIFWPWLVVVALLSKSAWPKMAHEDRRLIYLVLGLSALIIALLSCYFYWFGGPGYGPRLQVPLLPWLSLLAVVVLRGYVSAWSANTASPPHQTHQPLIAMGSVAVILAMVINVYGMMQPRSFFQWYHLPRTISTQQLMWDWRDPVFLAGIVGRERYTSTSPY